MKVLVVDNNTLFRQGLMKLLTSHASVGLVGEASDSWEAVIEARKMKPDLVILEPYLARGNDSEALRKIREETPAAQFLVLTVSEEEDDLWQAFRNGARGYLSKNSTPEQLFNAIEEIMQGEVAISPGLSGKILREVLVWKNTDTGAESRTELTPREREILELVSTGVSDSEVGEQLYIAASTVRHHVHNILQKLQLKNRVQLAMHSRNQRAKVPGNVEGGK